MPELPEVTGFKRYLDANALHHTITRVTVTDKRILEDITLQQLSRSLKGKALDKTERYGKYLFARVNADGWLLLHFGMSGRLSYYKDTPPPYAKVVLDFDNGHHLAYSNMRMIGKVGLVESPEQYVAEQGLGPDALSDRFTSKRFVALLRSRSGRQRTLRPIKAKLMDQSLLAGVGNEYSDEILFQAKLHPLTDVSKLTDQELAGVYRIMRRVLRTAAAKGGDVSRYPRGWIMPFRGKGEPCPACASPIKQIKLGARSGYFCPACQKQR